jgi:hypothetical protein
VANNRRINISVKRESALHATRISLGKLKLVYVLVADKRLRYPKRKSKIAYIGTTKRGLRRVASSVAVRTDQILALRGVRSLDARVVTCQPRQRVKSWFVLERALILTFRDMFGAPPKCNSHGKRMKNRDELDYFRVERLREVIEELS